MLKVLSYKCTDCPSRNMLDGIIWMSLSRFVFAKHSVRRNIICVGKLMEEIFSKINNCKTDFQLHEITHTCYMYLRTIIFFITKKDNFLDPFVCLFSKRSVTSVLAVCQQIPTEYCNRLASSCSVSKIC